jgi:hypothetical protein
VGRNFFAHCGLTATQKPEFRRCDCVRLCLGSGMGVLMIIDLDSWEAGYADGQLCRPSQCPANLDPLSYSSGYGEGRACRAETRRKAPRMRYPQVPT